VERQPALAEKLCKKIWQKNSRDRPFQAVYTGAFVLAAAGLPDGQAGGDALDEPRSPGRPFPGAQGDRRKVWLAAPGWLGHAFERRLGMAPSLFREMHRPAQASAA
jgi:hypothetical protein